MAHMSMENKQTKLNACSLLARERVTKDMEYVQLVASFVNPNSESNEAVGQVMSLMLMSCFKNLGIEKAKHIIDTAEQRSLNPLSQEFKDMVELDKWEDLYISNNNKLIQDEITKYSEVMRDLRHIQGVMMQEEKAKKGKQGKEEEYDDDEYSEEQTENRQEDDEYYGRSGSMRDQDLVLFGYEINKLSGTTKLALGLSLTLMLVIGFGIAVKKALSDLPVTKEKKSKKKKREDKDD
eukprot:CAMPEP_0170515382 /NCGR_PEP_ID=MMETSP0209-20121228/1823_1 /TAXON_ID=665100 ORGANISM="Litonotus pictus, Strain P1" /NCGR_SAMPLE_ID=MMETSP0209 /ASSEMBLY_ACC=CAM_ASM_000301 /LENGTH=236 /DNA_ID=CAMNT_0010799841 /DNA_START=170 /DNA_END=880 /DNA_ORIENTATION=-